MDRRHRRLEAGTRDKRWLGGVMVALAAGAVAVVPAQVASATAGHTFYVNSPTDTGSVTDCTTSTNTDCGIDDAVAAFNADTTPNDADTIVFNSSIAIFTVSTPTAINNTTSGVTLAINGSGASATTVSGGTINQVFDIATGTTVTISGLTIEKGSATFGGGIYNGGTTTVTDSTLSGNSASFGGGIMTWSGATMTVTDSTLSDNSATGAGQGDGGGIYNLDGTLTVTDTTLSGNSAAGTEEGGGGIVAAEGTTAVTDTTLSGNTAVYAGGGILGVEGTLAVTDTTLSGNIAGDYGGGIFEELNTTTVTNSTLSDNSAGDLGGGMLDNGDATTVTDSTLSGNRSGASGGGGIDNYMGELDYNPGTTTLGATIVANSGTSGGDCAGTITDAGYNIDSDGTCGFSATGSISDSAHLDASLGTLQNNGGPTDTILPASTSPAVGVIPSPTTVNGVQVCPRADQRGVASVGKCTIGAVEGVFRIAIASLPDASPATAYGPVTLTTQDAGVSTSPSVTSLKWKKVSLPKGLKLSKTGVLSGTPSKRLTAGTSSVKVSVTETVSTRSGTKKVKTKTTVQATIPLTIT
ncbi:MAG: choice-of-anchor Q domain-containing protein [Acidimicrobiales bacterium]